LHWYYCITYTWHIARGFQHILLLPYHIHYQAIFVVLPAGIALPHYALPAIIAGNASAAALAFIAYVCWLRCVTAFSAAGKRRVGGTACCYAG
jgi:hypothetical protein